QEIKQQFLEADKLIKEQPITTKKHENVIYTSKLIDTIEVNSKFEQFRISQDLKPSKGVCIDKIDTNLIL
ncbi:17442_t:CDS:1, partial [Cetraspora pellucida]